MKYETYLNMSDEEKEEYMDLLGERDGDPIQVLELTNMKISQGTLDDIVRNTQTVELFTISMIM